MRNIKSVDRKDSSDSIELEHINQKEMKSPPGESTMEKTDEIRH